MTAQTINHNHHIEIADSVHCSKICLGLWQHAHEYESAITNQALTRRDGHAYNEEYHPHDLSQASPAELLHIAMTLSLLPIFFESLTFKTASIAM